MCIMEIRAGQRASTIAQAMAHNTATVMGDVTMFRELLERRDEGEMIRALDRAEGELQRAFAVYLEMFGEFAKREEDEHGQHFTANEHDGADGTAERDQDGHQDHPQGHEAGTEHHHGHPRTFIEQAHHDATLARRYETR